MTLDAARLVETAEEAVQRYVQEHNEPQSLSDVIDSLTSPDLPEDAVQLAVRNLIELGVLKRSRTHQLTTVGSGH
jgi:hypothetical protein